MDTGGSSAADKPNLESEPFRSGGPGGKEADAQEGNIPREDRGSSCCVLQRRAAV